MTVRLQVIIHDEGLLESGALISLLNLIERTSRNAAAIVCIRISNEFKLPPSLVQLASVRIWSQEQSFFWIESVQPGSKKFLGEIVAPAIVAMVLTSTIGESLKEGWRETEVHHHIASSIPRIESFFVEEFQRLFRSDHAPPDDYFYIEPVVMRPEADETLISIQARQRRSRSKRQ